MNFTFKIDLCLVTEICCNNIFIKTIKISNLMKH